MFIRKIFYMLHVNRNQWLSREEIEELQFRQAEKIIHYAYNNVKFYKEKFDSCGIRPREIKSREDILRIPLTTKREVFNNYPHNMIAGGYHLSRCHIETTSGSSGLKLAVALDYKAKDFCDCVYGRALFAIGYKPWQPMAYFWPATHHNKESHEYLGFMRKNWISSHIKAEEQLDILLGLRPRIIYAFPSILVAIAKIIEKEKPRYSSIRPKFIVSHAELLTEETRKYIESIFACPVYNEYGATEFGFRMAWECGLRHGLHIDADSVLIEFLNNGKPVKPGERGEMVITGLVNHAMPLIRYKIGDIGIPSARRCACGRGLPLVEAIEGRDDDFITLPSGKIISPRAVTPLVRKHKDILEFRVVQKALDRIEVYAVTQGELSCEVISEIKRDLSDIMAEDINISVEAVKDLPRTERGKLQSVTSEIRSAKYL